MPAVVPQVSVSRVPAPAQATGVQPQTDADAPSDPFAALLEGCEGAPDALTALLAATQTPGVSDLAQAVKADQKADLPSTTAGKDTPPTQTQAQAALMLAVAKTTGLPPAPEGKKPDLPGKASVDAAAPEAQPDAETSPLPKDADPPDDAEPEAADASTAAPQLPVVAPAVPVPVPAPAPAAAAITGAASAETSETTPAVAAVSADVKPAPAPDLAVPVIAAQTAPVAAKTAAKTDKATAVEQPEADSDKPVVTADKAMTDEPAPTTDTGPHANATKSAAATDKPDVKSKADTETEKTADRAADLPAKDLLPDVDTAKAKAPAPVPSADPAANAASNAAANSPALPPPAMTQSPAIHGVPQAVHLSGSADAVPISGVAVEIAAHARDGKNHFDIRLDPPDLGRIDVRLHIDNDGQVTSHLRVDRVETLDLLRREAPALERALQDAGLKTTDSGLQFSLRDQSFSQHNQSREAPPTSARLVLPDEASATAETRRHYGRLAGLGGGVDIRV